MESRFHIRQMLYILIIVRGCDGAVVKQYNFCSFFIVFFFFILFFLYMYILCTGFEFAIASWYLIRYFV